MAYGKLKVDTITYDNSGSDVDVSVSALAGAGSAAPLASPTFTGTPAAPTASQGTNTTQVATTAFVNAEIAADTASKAPLASPTFTGTVTIPSGASIADIGTTIQAFDADTAKRDTTNTFTALQTLNAGLTVTGDGTFSGGITADRYKTPAQAVPAQAVDLSTGSYFTKTINANTTFTFTNPPGSGTIGGFTLELTHTSGTVTWPSSVKFPADTAPTLTAGKTHLFVFVTDDGGTRYRGAALADYVN